MTLEITFRGMDTSPAVETFIAREVAHLNLDEDCFRCAVVVELPHHHQTHGNRFHIRIDLNVAGRGIVVSRDPARDRGHESVYVALSDAFSAARRQLRDHASRGRSLAAVS